MKCKKCKSRTATQNELMSATTITQEESKTKEVIVVFTSVCKTCSLEFLRYNQEAIDMYLKEAQKEIALGTKVTVYGKNENLYDLM